MSTIGYGLLRRSIARGDRADVGVGKYIEVMAALVPAEVLVVHAMVVAATTEEVGGGVRITDPGTLASAFTALIALTVVLHILPRVWKETKKDWLKALLGSLIPAGAFVVWTMLQTVTAFDAAYPNVEAGPRALMAGIGAAVIITIAGILATQGGGGGGGGSSRVAGDTSSATRGVQDEARAGRIGPAR